MWYGVSCRWCVVLKLCGTVCRVDGVVLKLCGTVCRVDGVWYLSYVVRCVV